MLFQQKILAGSFKNLLIDFHYDLKLNIDTLKSNRESKVEDGLQYVATKYSLLKKIFDHLKLKPDDVFVDIGCGKGRAILFVASHYEIKKVIGVEADNKHFLAAKRNLKSLKIKKTNVFLHHCNAAEFNFREGTVFFLFHPFKLKTFIAVLDNIHRNVMNDNRKIRIVYVSPGFSHLLDEQPWLEFESNISRYVKFWHSKPT